MLIAVIVALTAIIVVLIILVVTRRVSPVISQVEQTVKMGLGASCVSAAPGTSLYSLQSCADGLSCDTNGFGTRSGICKVSIGEPCISIADCTSEARICSYGVCAEKSFGGIGQPPGTNGCDPDLSIAFDGKCRRNNGQSCLKDGDCAGNICTNGTCVAPLINGSPCDRNQECQSLTCNLSFAMGDCQNGGNPCLNDSDCVSGPCIKSDTDGICQDSSITIGATGSICNSLVPCDSGLRCTRDVYSSNPYGICYPVIMSWPSSLQCVTGSVGCPKSMICQGGECLFRTPDPTACVSSDDCPIGSICTNGTCKADSNPMVTGTTYQVWRWLIPERGTVSLWEKVPLTMSSLPKHLSVVRDNTITRYLVGDGTTSYYLQEAEPVVPITITYDTSEMMPANVPLLTTSLQTIKLTVVGGNSRMEILIMTTYNGDSRLILYQIPIMSNGNYVLPIPDETVLQTDTIIGFITIDQSSTDGTNLYLSGGGVRRDATFTGGTVTRRFVSSPTVAGFGQYYDQDANLNGNTLTHGSDTLIIPNVSSIFFNGPVGVGIVGVNGSRFPYYFIGADDYILPARVADSSIMAVSKTVGPIDSYLYLIST